MTNTPPRFQFTIRGLLWATFWVAVSVAVWKPYFRYIRPYRNMTMQIAVSGGGGNIEPAPDAILLGFYFLPIVGLIAPCIAIGALCGKPNLGFKVGIALVGIVGVIFLASHQWQYLSPASNTNTMRYLVLGLGILALFGLFEKKRAEMLVLVEKMKRWER